MPIAMATRHDLELVSANPPRRTHLDYPTLVPAQNQGRFTLTKVRKSTMCEV